MAGQMVHGLDRLGRNRRQYSSWSDNFEPVIVQAEHSPWFASGIRSDCIVEPDLLRIDLRLRCIR